MDWLNEIQAWFISATGSKIFLDAILPFVAIVLAGIIAASIGRSSATRAIDQHDRELTSAAVIALIVVGRKAAIWSSLGGDEKQHVDSLMTEADIRVRLLPTNGSSTAADWAAHELASMKKNSASFSFQADQSLIDYRDRLLSWAAKPRRARKLFSSDLEQWRYDDDSQAGVVAQQQQWATEHVEPAPVAAAAPAPAPTPAPTPAAGVAPAPTTPAPVTSSIPVSAPAVSAPAAAPATAPSAFAPPVSAAAPAAPAAIVVPTTTAPSTVTPGLATAAPPTVAPMDAPAPAGLGNSSQHANDDEDDE
jgi:hypothetical protein